VALVDDFPAIAGRLREIELCDCGQMFGHSYNCALFRCSVCRVLCETSPASGPTFCPDHCPDHDYGHERGIGHRCRTCGAAPPADWYDTG
jgi:hypothetical protein